MDVPLVKITTFLISQIGIFPDNNVKRIIIYKHQQLNIVVCIKLFYLYLESQNVNLCFSGSGNEQI